MSNRRNSSVETLWIAITLGCRPDRFAKLRCRGFDAVAVDHRHLKRPPRVRPHTQSNHFGCLQEEICRCVSSLFCGC